MTTERPAVSVIIPTYNRAGYVAETVRSVLAQSFRGYEVIVVDDGSTDDTREALKVFAGLPQFSYHHQPNGGRSSARNHGAAKSRGEFMLFLDSDDALFPDALDRLLEATARNPDAGMVVGESQFFEDGAARVPAIEPKIEAPPAGFTYPDLINGRYFLLPGALLIKRRCFEEAGGFDHAVEPCEDFDFYLRLALRHELAHVASPVLRYRVHGGNTPAAGLYRGMLRVARKHLSLLDASGELSRSFRRRSRAAWSLRMADAYYGLGEGARALAHYLRAAATDPSLALDPRLPRQVLASLIPPSLRERLKPRYVSGSRLHAPGER